MPAESATLAQDDSPRRRKPHRATAKERDMPPRAADSGSEVPDLRSYEPLTGCF